MPDGNLPGDQGKPPTEVQSRPDLFFISPAAKRLMGIKMEANGGAAPAALQGGGGGDQGQNGGGEQSKGSGGGFNWDLFPDVPEEQRPLLEPHLKQTQGHVTKLEQAFSPWKGFADAGMKPEYVQGLVAFDQAFNQDPVGTFLKLAENLQKEGSLTNELDLTVLKAIVEGKEVGEGGGEEGAAEEGAPQGDELPEWARQMQQENQEMRQRLDSRDEQETQAQRQAKFDEAMAGVQGQLKEAGFTDENMPDSELITGLIFAHKGDLDKVVASVTGLRDNVLTGFANGRKPESDANDNDGPTMPKGAPKSPKPKGHGVRSEFKEARAGAEQFLRQRQAAEAQE